MWERRSRALQGRRWRRGGGVFDSAREILGRGTGTLQEIGLRWKLHEWAPTGRGMVRVLAGEAGPAAEGAVWRPGPATGFTGLGGASRWGGQAAALLARGACRQAVTRRP